MIVENAQENRLKEYGINIKTKYKVDDQILERNTDHSKEDNIHQGIIIEKDYYRGTLLKKENLFDSRMLYTYEWNHDQQISCINCGMTGKIEDFYHGCPYCHTTYNMDYDNKELGSKHYFDLTIKDKSYVIKTYMIDFIVSILITSFFIIPNSRTFYFFDILKVVVGAILISLILFYFFYYMDALILLPGLKRKKEKQNQKQQAFWERMSSLGIDKVKFFNNFHYELRKYYYETNHNGVIDFDIIDFNSFTEQIEENQLSVKVEVDIRIVKYKNNKISSKNTTKSYLFKRVNGYQELSGGIRQISCPSCGASIDLTKKECEYCGREINFYQEWYLVKED